MIPNPANKAQEPSQQLDRQLTNQLADKHVSHARLAETLEQLRGACAKVLLQTIEGTVARNTEGRLWSAHQRVNAYFRSSLSNLRKAGDSKVVQRRRVESDYFKFIKASQKFYRGYIFDLAQSYGGIPELEKVAGLLKTPHANPSRINKTPTPSLCDCVLKTCHQTLIQLGDLSRYREMELSGEKPHFGPAIGFYDLAGTVCPSLGTSENQLAVIALAEGNFFRSTYHLYRSLSTEHPHPQAEGNLRKAFFKISNAWDKGELNPTASKPSSPDVLIAWYLRLVSKLFHGKVFPEHDELEAEVINRLSEGFKKNSLKNVIRRLVLINIAACSFAQSQFEKEPGSADCMQAFLYFLRLNARTASILFKSLHGQITSEQSSSTLAKKITPAMETILPAVRIYDIWLVKNAKIIANAPGSMPPKMQAEFWTTYARCLTTIASEFPVPQLCDVDHLLDEDADTLNFKPLHSLETKSIWRDGDRVRDQVQDLPKSDRRRPANDEQLARIRHFLTVGLQLAVQDQTVPLLFDSDTGKFAYDGHPLPQQTDNPLSDASAPTLNQTNQPIQPSRQKLGSTATDSNEQDIQAMRMVEDLVGDLGDLDDSSEPHSPPSSPPVVNAVYEDLQDLPGDSPKQSYSLSPRAQPFMPSTNTARDSPRPGMSPRVDTIRRDSRHSAGPSSPTTALHKSRSGFGHTRANSNDSLRSARSLWANDDNDRTTSPAFNQAPLGNGTFGALQADGDETIAESHSPLLFGAANSPWTMSGQESLRFAASSPRLGTPTRQASSQGWGAFARPAS